MKLNRPQVQNFLVLDELCNLSVHLHRKFHQGWEEMDRVVVDLSYYDYYLADLLANLSGLGINFKGRTCSRLDAFVFFDLVEHDKFK